jgi:hypothetical protein
MEDLNYTKQIGAACKNTQFIAAGQGHGGKPSNLLKGGGK